MLAAADAPPDAVVEAMTWIGHVFLVVAVGAISTWVVTRWLNRDDMLEAKRRADAETDAKKAAVIEATREKYEEKERSLDADMLKDMAASLERTHEELSLVRTDLKIISERQVAHAADSNAAKERSEKALENHGRRLTTQEEKTLRLEVLADEDRKRVEQLTDEVRRRRPSPSAPRRKRS